MESSRYFLKDIRTLSFYLISKIYEKLRILGQICIDQINSGLQGNLYGTRLDSVRAIIDEGRTAVLDPSPRSLKLLRNSSEFMPFIVFLGRNNEYHITWKF